MKRIIVALLIILFSVMVYAKTCKYSANGVKVSCVSKGITTFYNKDGGVRKKISKNVGAVMKRPVKVKLSGTRKEIKYYANKQIRYIQYRKNNIKHGDDIGYYRNGKMWWKTTWKNGKVDGEFITWYKDGNEIERMFYIDGQVISKSRDGKKLFYKDGIHYKTIFNGGQEQFYENGKLYKVLFSNGDITLYKDDKKHKTLFSNGTVDLYEYSKRYKRIYKNGDVEFYNNNGKISLKIFTSGKKQFYKNGKLYKVLFTSGKKEFYKNGKLYKIRFSEGQKQFYKDGKLHKVLFSNGDIIYIRYLYGFKFLNNYKISQDTIAEIKKQAKLKWGEDYLMISDEIKYNLKGLVEMKRY